MGRLSLIMALLLLVGCGGEEWVLIDDLAGRSATAACERLVGPDPAPVELARLRAATDSTLLVVDPGTREIVELDREGGRIATLELSPDGPRGIAMLADGARYGDSLFVVADAGRHRVRGFRPDGADLWTIQLDFPPQRLAFAGERLLATAAGMDGRLPALVYELKDGRADPLDVPLARHVDAIARMFVNDVVLEGYPDGTALVAHHFVYPRGWRLDADGTVEEHYVPVSRGVQSDIGYLPPIPFREEDMARIAAPVISAAADPRTGDLLYLTRTGRQRDGRSEKAIVRADGTFGYVSSRVLEMNAVALAHLPADSGKVIVVDFEGAWFRCEAP